MLLRDGCRAILFCSVWTGQDRTGQDRTGQDRTGRMEEPTDWDELLGITTCIQLRVVRLSLSGISSHQFDTCRSYLLVAFSMYLGSHTSHEGT